MKRFLIILATTFIPLVSFSQSIISVGDIIKVRKYISTQDSRASDVLANNGYTQSYQKSKTEFYFYKNCRLQIAHSNYSEVEIEASPKNEKATFICVSTNPYGGVVSATSYGKANFNKWVAQLRSLGYKNNGNGGEGNHGRSWEYSKSGSPNIEIWNDYSSTYVLSINY